MPRPHMKPSPFQQELVTNVYLTKSKPGAFFGPQKVLGVAKKTDPSLTISLVRQILSKFDSFTLNRPVKRTKKTRPYLSPGLGHHFQADLFVLNDSLARANRQKKYVIFLIDSFSRKIFARALKSKTGIEVRNAFISIFKERNYAQIRYITTDKGKEFLNFHVQKLFKEYGITNILSESIFHASLVERLNLSFRRWIARFTSHFKTKLFIPYLQNFVEGYNHMPHRALPDNLSPVEITIFNEFHVWRHQYAGYLRKSPYYIRPKFYIGQTVRLAKFRGKFFKASANSFTKEKYIVTQILRTQPLTYKVKPEEGGLEIIGAFYSSELQSS